jgi:hypothetical protein
MLLARRELHSVGCTCVARRAALVTPKRCALAARLWRKLARAVEWLVDRALAEAEGQKSAAGG